MTSLPLPRGARLVIDARVRRYRGGRVLAHASGGRVITLSAAGVRALEQLRDGSAEGAASRRLGRRLVDAGLAHPRPSVTGEAPSVTVVVPVRDRAPELDALLGALGTAHPVVVVSDGSADPDALARICVRHGARMVPRPQSGGPAAARNTGIAAVDSDLVAFIDSDCVPPAGWIERLTPHFADAALSAAAPRIRAHGPATTVRQRYLLARSPLDLGASEAAVGPGRLVSYVPTAAIVVRRSALVSGFDAGLRFGEDVDAIWRLHDAGGEVRYDPGVVVEHREPTTWRGVLRRRHHYGTSAAPLAARHPGRLAPLVLPPLPTAAALAVLASRPALAGGLTGLLSVRVARRLGPMGLPRRLAPLWALRAVTRTAIAMGRASTMLAAPLLLLAVTRRRLRRPALVLLLVGPVSEWLTRRPALDPVRWSAACVADDVAYGTGVWLGCLRSRTSAPLRPSRRAPG